VAKQAGERIRRATGTRTPLDVLRASLGLLRRTPEGDIEALMNGETLRVAAVRVGSGERRFDDLLPGLQRDPSIVWISRRGDRLPIEGVWLIFLGSQESAASPGSGSS
jgi:hypothetical protein